MRRRVVNCQSKFENERVGSCLQATDAFFINRLKQKGEWCPIDYHPPQPHGAFCQPNLDLSSCQKKKDEAG